MTSHYDVVVLGAGPGGYVAAIRAAQLGLSTAIIEKKYWGGVCLNVGCIPSKALLRNAELAHLFTKEAKLFGISGEASFDFGAAFDRSRKVADGRVKGIHFLMKKNKIPEYDGKGTFTDANTMEVELTKGGTETITFDNAIIATGSTTKLLPGTELSKNVVTYEEQIMTKELPGSILIVGAGAIGMEFGYILKNTAWGLHVYAVGDDPNAAELSGISTKRVIFSVYVVSGLIIGIAAWLTIGRVGSASPNPDPLLNLDTITAVVIGGTSLFGGRGTLLGTLIGAFIITVVQNGLSLAGLDQAYRVLAVGILVIAAVAIDQWIRKVKA